MEPVYTPVIGIFVSTFKVMGWKVVVEDAHHVPLDGPAVLASNHVGYLDFVFVGYGVREHKRLVRFAAKNEVFDHPVSGPLMRGMKHLPVDRDGNVNDIMEQAHQRLLQGHMKLRLVLMSATLSSDLFLEFLRPVRSSVMRFMVPLDG